MALSIAFWILAAVAAGAGLAVISLRNIFHAALALVLCFLAIAGIYVTLSADFLAVVQVLVYIGAISILIIIAIMLTREVHHGSVANRLRWPALLVAVVFLGVIVYAVLGTPWAISNAAPVAPTISALSLALFSQDGFVLVVEIAAVLLLAAVLGAIVIARDKS